MANKKNVDANKKNTEIKNKKSNKLEQKKPTQKKKRRLHSHLKVNIPLFQSLMMILPSLAKHAAAESIDNSSDAADQVTANNVTEKDVTDDHSKADSSAVVHQEAQTSDSDANSTLSASHAAHGSSSHLVPSHHLSTLSHPQVHYIPSVSMPTISSGSNGQPTHSNAPTTPALPVTFMPEVIKGTYGELHVDANGQYTFVLNPNSPQYILLNQHQPGTDHFALHLSNGSSIIVQIPVTGKQDTPSISGDLTGVVTEDHNIDSQGLLHANGKIDVIDPDQNESSVTPEVISGKYGSLTIDADGHWQYQVDNSLSNVQALTAATSLHESFTIHTKDGTPQTIDMTIGGNDDNAVITGVDAGTLTEDLTTQVQGQLSVTDSDLGEDHFQASQVTSNFGTLSITKDGAWTYSLDNNNPVVQRLGQGSTATDIVTVHSADGTAHQVMVTINGTNDHAVITSSTANSPSSFFAIGTSNGSSQVTEDKDLTVSGQLNITDIDSKEAHFSNSDLKGTLGTLHLKDNGDWTYDLDNKNPQVQALGQGSATTDIITIHSADGTPHQIAITVNGTNDKAVISGTSAGAVTEESQLQTSGTLAVTDVDTGEAHFATSSTGSTDIAGSFGTLHLTDTGSWTYDLDNTNPTVQALGKGSTATDTITVHSADGTPHQVTITVNGTNDAATVSSATVAIYETDKAVTTSGTLTSTDVDNPDNAFTPDSITGTNGNLTIGANGQWTFTANSAFNQLNVGDKVEETFTISSIDGTPSTIKVTINGTNDAATVSSATVAIDETDKVVTTSGTLTSTDVDNPDNTFTPDSIVGSNGDLTIDANGHWVFTANNAFNQLNVGDKVEETFTVSSIDGTPSTIKVTINGTNDAATVSSATVAIDETDKAVTTSGTLTSTDVDNPDNAFTPDSISGTNGDLTIDGNGHWVFTANSAFNQLNVGDKVEETFTISSIDGTTSTVKVTINGTNDAATVSSATVAIDETDKAVTTSGTLTSTDVDNPDNTFTPDSIAGTNGDLTIDANGHWVFTANSAFNQLNVGDKVEETFTVTSVDGTPSTIKVTINGTNDAATVSSATVAIDETDKAVTTSGTLTSTDVDNTDNTFTPDSVVGSNGDLTIDANGHWTFTANSAFNQLNVGDKVEETFTVTSVDGTPSTIKITINGTNDKAVISGTSAGAVTEESQLQTSGSLTVTDVDAGQAHFSNTDIAGTLGTLHLTNSGTWTYDLDNTNPTVQALGKGTTATDTITVHSADGTPHQITITVNGTNDKAIIGGTNSGAVTEESQLQTSGTLTVTDVDTGEAHFSNTDIAGTLGTLHLTDTGTWTYDLDNTNPQVQALGKGATATDTITVNSADGTPHQITITVNGTNDTTVIGGTSAGAVTEETQLQTSGSLTITDTDTGEAHFSNTDIKGSLGTLHLTDAGQWTYDLDNTNPTVQALGKGAATTDTITVSSADGTTHQVTIAVNGTNDKAVITGTNTGAVTEDQDLTNQLNVHPNYMLTQGKLFISDVDTNEATFPMQSGIIGDHGIGSFTLIPSGIWLFSADSKQAAVQALGVGETLTESTTITSVDGTQKTILVTINGTNDAPVITPVATQTVTEDGSKTITFHATDIDTTDTLTPSVSATHGSASLNAQGEIVFTPDANYNGPATVVLSVTDGHTTTSQTINVDVTPANDAPVINPIVPVSATEDGAVVTGQLTSTDIDTGDTATFTTTSTQGGFTLNADGSYNLDPTDASFQHLKAGEISTFTIPVTVTDSAGATDTKDLVITVTGSNDTPVISGVDTGALKEDVSANPQSNELTATGKLDIVDIDTGEGSFVSHGFNKTALQGHYGKLEISQDGSWSYSADNSQTAIQSLGEGEQLTDTIKVTSKDGTTHDVVVTISGTNDKAVIGGSNTGAVTEESQLQTSGTLTVTDVDTGEAHFANTDIQGSLGTLHLTDNGAWTYDLDNTNPAVQALGNGATATDTITVHSADGTPHQVTIKVNGTNDNAVVGGVDTASVTEKAAGDNMSPDHAQSGMATLRVSTLNANGHLSVIDPDSGQSGFADNNVGYNYHGTYGDLILNPNGDWNYYADAGSLTHIGGRPTTRGSAIDKLGEGETLTDTITVHTKDGTPHNIVITINGSNDRPYCSSEVQLNAGTEDTRQTITAAQLLQNSIDVDKNDSGLLTVANLHPDHGSILDNQNGTYTFTPEKDYNGKVHFTYDVKDAHGGVTHTGATSSLSAVADKAVISGSDTGTIIEDHNVGHSSLQPVVASGLLSVTDPDAGQDHFQVNLLLGEQAIHDPFGGFLRITPSGAWGYEVANSRLQSLAEGEVEKVVYRVYSADHTAHDITITVTGTNDQPSITATTLAHGTEDTHYQMQSSQFGFNDIDTGDTLHSIAITDLPPATQGKFVLDGHDITAGQHIPTADISKLQFVPAQDFNGDVQFKYTVNDGHTDSAEATNTLHIDAVGDKAVISGVDTGDVYENRNPDMSPDFAQSGMAHLTNSMIHVEGQLTIIDPDTGENSFDSKGIGYTYHGKYGHLILNTDGKWFYGVATGTADVNGGLTTNVGSTIDQLGANETLTDTITIQSKDGTTHDIVITIHGDNDRPYCSSEVQLNSGKEDLAQTITATELLANTIDVDSNDLGKLTVANLLVDHGSVVDNKDGTYTFTPTKDYNGQVHFSYDVTDAHGGVTHTGASTTLAAVDDKTIISGVDHGVATEDIATHMSTNANIMDAVDWQALQVTDVDSPNTQVTVEFAGKQYTWNIGRNLDVTTPYGKFQFHTIASGSHKGEHSWSYIGDNNNVHVQELKHGESLTESIKLIATDGTEFPITVKVNGTEDGIIIDSKSELGHVVENAQTGASVSGSAIAHDVDLHDTVSWTQTPTAGLNGQYGTFHLSADGQWHYNVDQNKATKLGDGDEYWEHFTVEAVSTDGSHVSKSVSVVVHGNNDVPTVSGEVTLPSAKEDTSIHITQAELIANATDIDTNDRGWLHVQNLTADHGSLVSNSDGSFTFNPDPNYNGAVHFTYDVADRHGGIAHTGANTTLAAVNDAAVFGGVDTGNVTEDHNAHVSVQGNYAYMLEARGTLTATDTDAGESGFDFKTLMTASAHPEWAPYQSRLGGQLEIDQHGNWNYYIDNRKPEVQSLGVSETLTDTVTVNSKDGTSHIITVTIHGTNDAPILNVQQSSNVSGTLLETDLDTNDSHTFSVVSSAGQFGSLSVDPNTGDYVYTPNTSITGMSYNSATNSYHGVDVFEVKVSDGHTEDSKFITFDASGHVTMSPTGGLVISTTVPQQPTVTTTLPTMQMVTNVAPTNSVTLDLASTSDSGSSNTDNLTNDTTPTITGHTDIPFSKVTIYDGSTPVGHAVSDASGQYNVVVSSLPNGDHNLSAKALAPSSTLPATSPALSVHVDTDIAPLQVSLTHDTGRSTSDLITSDGALTISGQETGATIEYSVDGGHTWSNTFTPQTGSNTVEVRQTDTAGNISTSSSLTFTLDNTATAPSVSLTSDSGGSSSDKITNVGDLSVGGIEQGATVEYSIDNGVHWSTQFTPAEGQNNVQVRQTDVAGNVSPSTSLSYTLDTQIDIRVNSAQVDQHGQGMMVQVYLPKDSEVTLLEITSDGGGAPLLVDLKTVQRQGTGTSVSHPDHQYQEFVGIDLSSLPDGNLIIRVAGTDTAGNTVTAQSSASSNYVLDTTASASDDSNTAIEDSTIPVSGNLLSNDADAATVTTTGDIQGTYGLFHLNKDGSYTYTLDNQLSTIQQLNSTSTPLVDSITYTASDSHGNLTTAHLAISIQGTDDNHPPAVTGQTVSTNEDTSKTFTTSEFGYSDQDGDALQFVTINSIPSHGLLLLNGKAVIANQQISKAELDAGHLTFTPINNENATNYAQFTFTANDGHQNSASATMILNVNAVNDAPIVGSSFISSLEDKPHAFTAADFKYSDIDGDALNHITITNVAHGVLTLNGATVNVGDDVSASDISSLIFTPTHNYFSSNTNGLGAVQFTANDGHIDSKEGSIFINIADVADPATFGGDSTGAAQEDTTLQASGTLTASDPDGTAGFIAVQSGVGIVGSKGYGHAHIDSNGHWTYDLYNKHPIVQQLGQGQTDTETITIQSADGTQHDIVITITGTNDLPTVSEKPQAGHITGQHSVDEDSNLNPAGQLIINDVDGDTTSVALDPTHSAAYGHVVFDAHSGTWVYHLDNSNPTVNALNDNDTLQDKFTLLVDDGHGQKVPQEITMTINGHTDPVPYAPPTISVTVDTRNTHHVTAGITPSTLQAYAHSIRAHATTVSGSHEIKGHGHSDIIIVSGRLHEEAELEGGNDILFLGGRLTDKEIEGGHGSDTLILGAYNRNNAPRLHDHGEKISDGHEEMELESIENIILGDGTVLKGHLPANFPLVTHDHYEVPVNIQAHLSSGDESVSSIRLTHLQQGLTLQSNGHNINANHDGSYTVPANGHLVVVSDHAMNNGHHYFETEVTTHNSVTGVTAVTTEDLQGHLQSHVNPPPPPPPPVQHDEPDSPLTFEASVTIVDDSNTPNEQQHVGTADSQHHDVSHHGAAAYLDALGITPDATSTTVHDQPADMDIVLAQVDQPDAATHDQAHLDMSDALEHHDANINHNQDDEHHHHNDIDGLPDIDPNS
ncbi:VCBS domain-containing protein [Vibrio splendidus]|uniref:VCBS domain-containing protein n=1 Tax=Vibrio splendidus TaxID=29497 RepID=UPI0015E689AD|nr:VCBS domain-containing protein [Vibrio splendidus]